MEYTDGDSKIKSIDFWRFIVDLLYNFIVLMLVANLLMGIIIDKFGNLRDKLEQIKDEDKQFCFICG
jgi:hypothetical protein